MAKQRDSAAWLKKCIKDRCYWIEHSGEVINASDRAGIRRRLEQGDFDAVKVLPNALDRQAHYYGAPGSIGLIKGDSQGWIQVDRAVKYDYWRIKFAAAVALMQTRPDYPEKFNPFNQLMFEMPIIPGLICYAIVHDLEEMRNELWALWKAILNTPDVMRENYWGPVADGQYELFSFRLFAQAPWGGGAELPELRRFHGIGPYAHLFDAWGYADALTQPLCDICDYHCANMSDDQEGVVPFAAPPFDFVPYELLAIHKLREQQGLETPEIDHPLMKLPTASREPREVHPIDDPVFAEIEALFNKHCQPFWNETLRL